MNYNIFNFGFINNEPVQAALLQNDNGMSAVVIEYGAALQSLVVPDKQGNPVDVVLGYDTLEEYAKNDGNLGATIGRFANRIKEGRFTLNGREYQLAVNNGPNHLHGGVKGFDKRMWHLECKADTDSVSAVLTRLSLDGEEGYPGNLELRVTYRLDNDNRLSILYDAVTDQDTIVNLTNHSYFNLNGAGDVLGHLLTVRADRILENDSNCLPTGRMVDVAGTPFDFRTAKAIGQDISATDDLLQACGGYDHDFLLVGHEPAAVLVGDVSGIRMKLWTDRPGMQVYTANFLTEREGKKGALMARRSAVCLETMGWSDSINHPDWPQAVLRAGEHYEAWIVLGFE